MGLGASAAMNTSRLSVALAVIGAFVAGICVGSFTGNGSLAPGHGGSAVTSADVRPRGVGSHAASKRAGGSEALLAPEGSEELVGDELVKRVWTTLTIGDENERHAEWLRLLPTLNAQDALAIRDLFRKMDAQGRHFTFEWASFWPRWGEVDGTGALAYLANNESPNWRPEAAEMIVRGWAKADPNAARAWLFANVASPFHDGALSGYIDGLARTDLARATTEALTLGAGKDMSKVMESLTEQALQQRQLGGMMDWWQSLPDDPSEGSARRAAIQAIYSRLQFADVDRAQDWMTQLAATPYRDDDRLGEVAEKIAQKDAGKAVEWIASIPPSPADGHYIAIGRTMRAWGQQDSAAAEAWLNQLPVSPLRDQALIAYTRYLRGAQSPMVDYWLAQVQDQELVQQQQQRASQVMIYTNVVSDATDLLQSVQSTGVIRRRSFDTNGEITVETISPPPARTP